MRTFLKGARAGGLGLVLGAVLACGVDGAQDTADEVEAAGNRSREIVILPTVELDGLDALANRSGSSVFVEELLMHADAVAVLGRLGRLDLKGSDDAFFHYQQGGQDTGLNRLSVHAQDGWQTLRLEVGPLDAEVVGLDEESRMCGVDLEPLRGHSIIVRGLLALDPDPAAGVGSPDLTGQGRSCSGGDAVSCHGTVPDTAPAHDGKSGQTSTVPDTAPAHDEVDGQKVGQAGRGEGAAIPRRSFKPFELRAEGQFVLQADLDADVLSLGGRVALHLDAAHLLSEKRVADLDRAARDPTVQAVVMSLPVSEFSAASHLRGARRGDLSGPAPR